MRTRDHGHRRQPPVGRHGDAGCTARHVEVGGQRVLTGGHDPTAERRAARDQIDPRHRVAGPRRPPPRAPASTCRDPPCASSRRACMPVATRRSCSSALSATPVSPIPPAVAQKASASTPSGVKIAPPAAREGELDAVHVVAEAPVPVMVLAVHIAGDRPAHAHVLGPGHDRGKPAARQDVGNQLPERASPPRPWRGRWCRRVRPCPGAPGWRSPPLRRSGRHRRSCGPTRGRSPRGPRSRRRCGRCRRRWRAPRRPRVWVRFGPNRSAAAPGAADRLPGPVPRA